MKKLLVGFLLLISIITLNAQEPMTDVELTWDAPTNCTDGSPLLDLLGHRLYRWTNETSGEARTTNFVTTTNLHPVVMVKAYIGPTNFFAVSALNTNYDESALSEVLPWYVLPNPAPRQPSTFTLLSDGGPYARMNVVIGGRTNSRIVTYEHAKMLWDTGR